MVTIRKDQAVAIREEYHAFRGRAVWVMFVVPLALYLGMKRADSVVQDSSRHHSKYTLTPPLLTGGGKLLRRSGWLYGCVLEEGGGGTDPAVLAKQCRCCVTRVSLRHQH